MSITIFSLKEKKKNNNNDGHLKTTFLQSDKKKEYQRQNVSNYMKNVCNISNIFTT